jgi:hypothetical protein
METYVVFDEKNKTIRKFKAKNWEEAKQHVLNYSGLQIVTEDCFNSSYQTETYEELGLFKEDD